MDEYQLASAVFVLEPVRLTTLTCLWALAFGARTPADDVPSFIQMLMPRMLPALVLVQLLWLRLIWLVLT